MVWVPIDVLLEIGGADMDVRISNPCDFSTFSSSTNHEACKLEIKISPFHSGAFHRTYVAAESVSDPPDIRTGRIAGAGRAARTRFWSILPFRTCMDGIFFAVSPKCRRVVTERGFPLSLH